MAIRRNEENKLVQVTRNEVFSNDGNDLEQRAQFSVTGFGCYYELYYHTEWDRAVLECAPEDPASIAPSTFFKVDVENVTIGDTIKMLLSTATGGAVSDFIRLEIWEPWNQEVGAENYKDTTVKAAPISQFTVVTSWRSQGSNSS
jgi:hypothetical protein